MCMCGFSDESCHMWTEFKCWSTQKNHTSLLKCLLGEILLKILFLYRIFFLNNPVVLPPYLHHFFSKGPALPFLPNPVCLPPSLSLSGFPVDETEHGFSLSARLLPLFDWWCFFSLPLVLRARRWALIPDCAALLSASRCCWERMAQLQDPCAHTGEKWTNERDRERGRKERGIAGLFSWLSQMFACALRCWVLEFSLTHTLSHKQERKGEDDGRVVAAVGSNVNEERGNLSHVLSSTTLQPFFAWLPSSLFTLKRD